VSLVFQNSYFVLYVLIVWIYVFISTKLLAQKGNLYFRQQMHDPTVVNARNSQLVSLLACGSAAIIVVLLLTPYFTSIFGMPDLIDFLIAFSGAAIIEVYSYSRTVASMH